jgi:hypothetical protein
MGDRFSFEKIGGVKVMKDENRRDDELKNKN